MFATTTIRHTILSLIGALALIGGCIGASVVLGRTLIAGIAPADVAATVAVAAPAVTGVVGAVRY